jgi:hypothetical protein
LMRCIIENLHRLSNAFLTVFCFFGVSD